MEATLKSAGFGPVTLFGSGETLPASGKTYELIASMLRESPRISIIETPAGFQPNSEIVAAKVAEFIQTRLQNYHPDLDLIPARHKTGKLSTNNPALFQPLLKSNWLFLGPGSPTYAVKQLQGSLLLDYLYAHHSLGSALTFSSAGVLAISAFTLPVYEIYKVGEDLHWVTGLNFLSRFGLDLVFIPHWNNTSGGDEFDTRRCYMGLDRFEQLRKILPRNLPIIGIDEQTALTFTFNKQPKLIIKGNGSVTIDQGGHQTAFSVGEYNAEEIGLSINIPDHLPTQINDVIEDIEKARAEQEIAPPAHIIKMAEERLEARRSRAWEAADNLRNKLSDLGWDVLDSAEGYELKKK